MESVVSKGYQVICQIVFGPNPDTEKVITQLDPASMTMICVGEASAEFSKEIFGLLFQPEHKLSACSRTYRTSFSFSFMNNHRLLQCPETFSTEMAVLIRGALSSPKDRFKFVTRVRCQVRDYEREVQFVMRIHGVKEGEYEQWAREGRIHVDKVVDKEED